MLAWSSTTTCFFEESSPLDTVCSGPPAPTCVRRQGARNYSHDAGSCANVVRSSSDDAMTLGGH